MESNSDKDIFDLIQERILEREMDERFEAYEETTITLSMSRMMEFNMLDDIPNENDRKLITIIYEETFKYLSITCTEPSFDDDILLIINVLFKCGKLTDLYKSSPYLYLVRLNVELFIPQFIKDWKKYFESDEVKAKTIECTKLGFDPKVEILTDYCENFEFAKLKYTHITFPVVSK